MHKKITDLINNFRQESEVVNELKNVMGVEVLPAGILMAGTEGIQNAIRGFEDAKMADIHNERLPPTTGESSFTHEKICQENVNDDNA